MQHQTAEVAVWTKNIVVSGRFQPCSLNTKFAGLAQIVRIGKPFE
jgi:hypothetical protein